jgi:hypothetical protein
MGQSCVGDGIALVFVEGMELLLVLALRWCWNEVNRRGAGDSVGVEVGSNLAMRVELTLVLETTSDLRSFCRCALLSSF